MPKRRKTGANMLTIDEMGAVLNMSNEEMMVLVKNGVPHHKHDEPGRGVYYMFPDREVLAVVKPLPPNRKLPVVAEPVVEEEEDEPIETVRPKPRMESTAPPVKAEEKPAVKPKSPAKPKPAKPTK